MRLNSCTCSASSRRTNVMKAVRLYEDGLRLEEAAALPMPGRTAWQGLVTHGRLKTGERVIVTGARGGVGHVAVQLVRHLGAQLVDEGAPCDLLFDTAGGDAFARSARDAARV